MKLKRVYHLHLEPCHLHTRTANLMIHALAHQRPCYSVYAATVLGCDCDIYRFVSGEPCVPKTIPSCANADLATPPRAHLLWRREDSVGGLTAGSHLSERAATRMLASERALMGGASLRGGGSLQPASPASSGDIPSSSVRLLVTQNPLLGNDARSSARTNIAYVSHCV